jgi:hypothetical protein
VDITAADVNQYVPTGESCIGAKATMCSSGPEQCSGGGVCCDRLDAVGDKCTNTKNSSGSSAESLAGGVVGGVLGVSAMASGVFVLRRRRGQQQQHNRASEGNDAVSAHVSDKRVGSTDEGKVDDVDGGGALRHASTRPRMSL